MTAADKRAEPLEPPNPNHAESRGSSQPESPLLHLAERYGLLALLLMEICIFSVLRPETFPTVANFRAIATSTSVIAVASLAVMIPMIAGRFDVSVGANIAFASVISAKTMSDLGLPLIIAVVVAVVSGAVIGAINGFVVAYFGVNSIIATIGTATVIAGIATAVTGGVPITTDISPSLLAVGLENFLGVPRLFFVAMLIALVVGYVLAQTPAGRYLTAVGSNESAAYLNGLSVRRLVFGSLLFAGAVAGLGGTMQVAASGSGDPGLNGLSFILPALAAVFLGATTIRPGKFNVPGTILALIFIATTISGLVLIGLQPWVSDVFNGSAVVIAMAASAQIKRRRTGSLEVGA